MTYRRLKVLTQNNYKTVHVYMGYEFVCVIFEQLYILIRRMVKTRFMRLVETIFRRMVETIFRRMVKQDLCAWKKLYSGAR